MSSPWKMKMKSLTPHYLHYLRCGEMAILQQYIQIIHYGFILLYKYLIINLVILYLYIIDPIKEKIVRMLLLSMIIGID